MYIFCKVCNTTNLLAGTFFIYLLHVYTVSIDTDIICCTIFRIFYILIKISIDVSFQFCLEKHCMGKCFPQLKKNSAMCSFRLIWSKWPCMLFWSLKCPGFSSYINISTALSLLTNSQMESNFAECSFCGPPLNLRIGCI